MRRPLDAIVWWEVRRVPYNAALAVLGVTTIGIIFLIGSHFVASGEDVEEPVGLIVGAVLYAIAANVFYTLGWISELLWSGGDTSRTENFRKRVFYAGLVLSCVITLLPTVVVPALWLIFGFQHSPPAQP